MVEKKKARTRKSMRNLPAKGLSSKAVKRVKGGTPVSKKGDLPTESISLNYGEIKWKY